MFNTVEVHQKVEKTLEQMSLLDNAPKYAALKAQSIIQALVGGTRLTHAGRLSQHKDVRIKNLYKFDLGKGYRLVTIKEKGVIFVLFIGTHDQCDRWLDANSKKKPHLTPIPTISYAVDDVSGDTDCGAVVCGEDDSGDEVDMECDYFPDVSQDALRKVFCGLTGNS